MKKKIVIIIFSFLVIFSLPVWARDLDEILKSGHITVATRDISPAIYQKKNTYYPGFCYEIAKNFAESIDVSLKLKIVKSFSDYWKKGDTILLKTNPLKITTPDIYKNVDMVVDIITVTDKRKKLVNMIPFVENKELFFGRKGLKVKGYEGLKGLKIFTYEGISFYSTIKKELKRRGIPYVIRYVKVNNKTGELIYLRGKGPKVKDKVEILVIPSDAPKIKFLGYYQILLGHADVSLQDSFSFLSYYYGISAFRDGLEPLFPAKESIGYLSFCTSYDTPKLNKRLKAFMKEFKKSPRFDVLFKKYMGISYKQYKELLEIGVK